MSLLITLISGVKGDLDSVILELESVGAVKGNKYERLKSLKRFTHICVNMLHFAGGIANILYVQEVVTQPKILNRTILYNLVHVT